MAPVTSLVDDALGKKLLEVLPKLNLPKTPNLKFSQKKPSVYMTNETSTQIPMLPVGSPTMKIGAPTLE